jgi:hypothetical protein
VSDFVFDLTYDISKLNPAIPRYSLTLLSWYLWRRIVELEEIRGGFHKSWVYGLKRKAHPNVGENAVSWAYGANT